MIKGKKYDDDDNNNDNMGEGAERKSVWIACTQYEHQLWPFWLETTDYKVNINGSMCVCICVLNT